MDHKPAGGDRHDHTIQRRHRKKQGRKKRTPDPQRDQRTEQAERHGVSEAGANVTERTLEAGALHPTRLVKHRVLETASQNYVIDRGSG